MVLRFFFFFFLIVLCLKTKTNVKIIIKTLFVFGVLLSSLVVSTGSFLVVVWYFFMFLPIVCSFGENMFWF